MMELFYSALIIIALLGYWYVYIFAYHRGWNAGFDKGIEK